MKRDNDTRKERASTEAKVVIGTILGLFLLDIIVAGNMFFLESVPYIDQDGQAGFKTHMLFGIVLDYPITSVGIASVAIIVLSIFISVFLLWEGGPVENSDYTNVAFPILTIAIAVGFMSILMGFLIIKSETSTPNSMLMGMIIEQKHEPKSESSLYRFSSESHYMLKGELFLRTLDGYEHTADTRKTPQNSDNMIDTIEHKNDNPDTPQYRTFKLVELEDGEYHLFSYDSRTDIDHVNDVVDIGELDKKEFNTFKSLVEKVK